MNLLYFNPLHLRLIIPSTLLQQDVSASFPSIIRLNFIIVKNISKTLTPRLHADAIVRTSIQPNHACFACAIDGLQDKKNVH